MCSLRTINFSVSLIYRLRLGNRSLRRVSVSTIEGVAT